MTTVKAVREAMRVVANAQTLLRETSDKRAHAVADELEGSMTAMSDVLEACRSTNR